MKRFFCFIFTFISMFSHAYALSLSAETAVLIDADTSEILYQKNAHQVMSMASTTKIMTALIAIENANLTQNVTIKQEYTTVEGSSMYLKPDEVLSIKELLYGLMLMSGNDAALALAHETTGDFDEFIALMNQKCTQLGLENTAFKNPNGLDQDGHHTTAYELAKITAHALQNELFSQIVSSQYYKSDTRTMKNHNKMLWLQQESIGVKTGFTKKSGRCLVSAIQFGGKKLIAVTLNAPSDWADHTNLYEYGKSLYKEYNFYTKNQKYDIININAGDQPTSAVVLSENLSIWLTEKQKQMLKMEVFAPKIVYAPVSAGDVYGSIQCTIQDIEILNIDLLYAQDIHYEDVQPMDLLDKFFDFIKNLFY